MKQLWHKWSERIDAMMLRERAIVFFAAALVLLFLFDAMLSGPVTDRQRKVARQLAQKQMDTRRIQEQVQLLIGRHRQDPNAEQRAQIEELKQRLAEIDVQLAEKQHELVAPDRVPGLLEEMLRRERGLQLVDLRSLPPEPLFENQAGSTSADGTAVATLQAYRHGVELTVRGGYFDLVRYLDDLEQLPLRMFWRQIDIDGEAYPRITMKLSVYTLSLERTWVVV